MSTTIATLKAMIVADASGLVDGLDITKREIREASRIVEDGKSAWDKYGDAQRKAARLVAGQQLTGDQAASWLAKQIPMADLVDEPTKGLKALAAVAGDANKQIGLMPSLFSPATAAMAAMAAGSATLAGGLSLIGATISERMTALDDLGDAAAKLGMSASALSEIRGAAFLGDVDTATVDSMVQKMLVAVGKEKAVFAELGLDVDKLKQKNPAAMFGEIADAINALPTKAEQMAAIAEAFGKSGPEGASLVARFGELSQAMRDSGAVASGELADGVGMSDDALKRLTLSAEAFGNTLAGISAGPVTTVLDTLTAAANMGAFERASGFVVGMAAGPALGGHVTAGLLAESNANREAAQQDRLKDSQDAIDAALEDEIAANEVAADQIAKIRQQNFRQLIEDDARFEREMQQARVRDAIRAIDEEERARRKANADRWDAEMKAVDDAQKIRDSLRTPAEATQDRLLADFDALRRGGMDSAEARDRLVRRAAGEMARGETGGFGAPGADKGTRAAREAIIGAKLQQDQLTELRRIEDRLREILERGGVTVEELSR